MHAYSSQVSPTNAANSRCSELSRFAKICCQQHHNVSQSPFVLPMFQLCQCLAIPVKENRNNFHLIVLSEMPAICKHA